MTYSVDFPYDASGLAPDHAKLAVLLDRGSLDACALASTLVYE